MTVRGGHNLQGDWGKVAPSGAAPGQAWSLGRGRAWAFADLTSSSGGRGRTGCH